MAIYTHFHIRCVLKPEYVNVIKTFCTIGHWFIPQTKGTEFNCIRDWLGFLRIIGKFRVFMNTGMLRMESNSQKKFIRNSQFRQDKLDEYIRTHPEIEIEYDLVPWTSSIPHRLFHGSHCEVTRESSNTYVWTLIGNTHNEYAEIEKFINIVILNVSSQVRRCWLSNSMDLSMCDAYYDLSDTFLRENNIYVVEPPPRIVVVEDPER